jgi:hypothetical protein
MGEKRIVQCSKIDERVRIMVTGTTASIIARAPVIALRMKMSRQLPTHTEEHLPPG